MPGKLEKKLIIKFLGTSSEESIPREGCECVQCLSKDKNDNRLRSSVLINKKIMIDATPDVLKQLSKRQIDALEAVLITHEHADHNGGIKDLLRARRDIRIIKLAAGQHFKLLGIDFHAFKVKHSNLVPTVGVEINSVIYIPDYADLDWAMPYLKNTKFAILDGSVLGRNFGGHLSINETVALTKPLKNLRKIYLTHNGHTRRTHKEMQKLVHEIGDSSFVIAYDGLEIEV
ncbi:TPA: hypothetical protein DD449_01330 [Candidatus Berkelbacteria bacterium]|uniref:Metallo-beta-lactamase domain-containing protein n=1 Tax=Berkelbacteria bacterium GW2011_GWE1_39_12 TaxID=1618337 RepID=A0A0G4B412_9BACT|nr:MAG: hypothetical protein UT28_C0001G0821 [Berkelbacteria bacterium GW2011_GWE1_39_12]HBO60313.1 hypothetical protein [Candidatus Berkelbacteria bacterium]